MKFQCKYKPKKLLSMKVAFIYILIIDYFLLIKLSTNSGDITDSTKV